MRKAPVHLLLASATLVSLAATAYGAALARWAMKQYDRADEVMYGGGFAILSTFGRGFSAYQIWAPAYPVWKRGFWLMFCGLTVATVTFLVANRIARRWYWPALILLILSLSCFKYLALPWLSHNAPTGWHD